MTATGRPLSKSFGRMPSTFWRSLICNLVRWSYVAGESGLYLPILPLCEAPKMRGSVLLADLH
jgi:hypothetical protein